VWLAEYTPTVVLREVFALVTAVWGRVCKTVGTPNHDMVIQLIRKLAALSPSKGA